MSSPVHTTSPGNALYPDIPPMRAPHLEYVYRLQAVMAEGPNAGYEMKRPQGSWSSRSVIHIAGGTVKGPGIDGVVVPGSGADWAEEVFADKIFYRLDARYAVRTSDGHYIYIQAKGIYRIGPDVPFNPTEKPPVAISQDDVEYFSHLTFEAGEGPYDWMNGCVCVGVMSSFEDQVCIDAWRLTNFPGKKVETLNRMSKSCLPPRSEM